MHGGFLHRVNGQRVVRDHSPRARTLGDAHLLSGIQRYAALRDDSIKWCGERSWKPVTGFLPCRGIDVDIWPGHR
jgi:hypothetical protein